MKNLSSKPLTQQKRLLEFLLANHKITTVQVRTELDIMHPAARVQELKERGNNIFTHRRTVDTDQGQHKKVAEYVLLNGGLHAQ